MNKKGIKIDVTNFLDNMDILLEESETWLNEQYQDPNSEVSKKLKKRIEDEKENDGKLHCPKCNGVDLKFIKDIGDEDMILMTRYKCKDCGKVWDEADPGLL